MVVLDCNLNPGLPLRTSLGLLLSCFGEVQALFLGEILVQSQALSGQA